jgi:hypothetical protein
MSHNADLANSQASEKSSAFNALPNNRRFKPASGRVAEVREIAAMQSVHASGIQGARASSGNRTSRELMG